MSSRKEKAALMEEIFGIVGREAEGAPFSSPHSPRTAHNPCPRRLMHPRGPLVCVPSNNGPRRLMHPTDRQTTAHSCASRQTTDAPPQDTFQNTSCPTTRNSQESPQGSSKPSGSDSTPHPTCDHPWGSPQSQSKRASSPSSEQHPSKQAQQTSKTAALQSSHSSLQSSATEKQTQQKSSQSSSATRQSAIPRPSENPPFPGLLCRLRTHQTRVFPAPTKPIRPSLPSTKPTSP